MMQKYNIMAKQPKCLTLFFPQLWLFYLFILIFLRTFAPNKIKTFMNSKKKIYGDSFAGAPGCVGNGI